MVIDIGNTCLKTFYFSPSGTLCKNNVYSSTDDFIRSDLSSYPSINAAIICSVTNDTLTLQDFLSEKTKTLVFQPDMPLPIINNYGTKQTLGSDRLAAAIGANSLFPNQNTLVIDAGTCIKYNFINSKAEFLGGAIAPGLSMRLKALHHFTDRLPLISTFPKNDLKLIGKTTEESILLGVYEAALFEMKGFIAEYKMTFNELNIILTGGDASFFETHLKNSIFADPYLIAKGLNTLLNYNLSLK